MHALRHPWIVDKSWLLVCPSKTVKQRWLCSSSAGRGACTAILDEITMFYGVSKPRRVLFSTASCCGVCMFVYLSVSGVSTVTTSERIRETQAPLYLSSASVSSDLKALYKSVIIIIIISQWDTKDFLVLLLLARLVGQICVACRRQSVRPPMEHYTEVGSADSVAPYRSSLRRLLPGNILVTNKKICLNMNTVCTFDAGVRPQLLTLQCDRRNLLLTIIVCCIGTVKGERKAGQLLIAVAIVFHRANVMMSMRHMHACT